MSDVIYGLFIDADSIPLSKGKKFIDELVELGGFSSAKRLSGLDEKWFFYIGRTDSFQRRQGEHKRAKGDKHAYQMIRLIEKYKVSWEMVELEGETCESTAIFNASLAGHPLCNGNNGNLNQSEWKKTWEATSDANIADMEAKRRAMQPETDRRRMLLAQRMRKISKK